MKGFLKSTLSIVLALTIILSSAAVGLAQVDFGRVGCFLKGLVPEFSVKADAASSGSCGSNLTWTLDDEGTLTISGTGAMNSYSSSSLVPWYSSRSKITSVVIYDGVTSIGNRAFLYCGSLPSIIIPDSVTSIGQYAFSNCDRLTSVSIGNGVTTISDYAFYYCTNLTSITIPDSVTGIGNYAFRYCDSLTSVYITDILAWCNIEFAGYYSNPLYYAGNLYVDGEKVTDLVIPSSVTNIGDYAFYNYESLTSITIPDSVTGIGNYAFRYCDSLTSVYITDILAWCNIEFAGYYSNPLYYAGNLYINGEKVTDLVIPSSVTNIGDYAFYNYESLTSITIPDSVTTLGKYAFANCSLLDKISLGENLMNISPNAFLSSSYYNNTYNWENDVLYISNYLIKTKTTISNSYVVRNHTLGIACESFKDCTLLQSIDVPNTVKFIGDSAYEGCTSLATVNLGEGLNILGEKCFSNCESLTEISIPNNVKNIPHKSFYNCNSLKEVVLGNLLETVGNYAFYDCTELETINLSSTLKEIGDYAFHNCYKLSGIILSNSITNIGKYAFYYCKNLNDISLPNQLKQIKNGTFAYCTNITKINIPDSVSSIGSGAFLSSGLQEVVFGCGLTVIDSDVFSGCEAINKITISDIVSWCEISFLNNYSNPMVYTNNIYIDDEPLGEEIFIPEGVNIVNKYAFYNCSKIKKVVFSDTVTYISEDSFRYCTNLETIIFGAEVKTISDNAFYQCGNIHTIALNNNIVNIGTDAFYMSIIMDVWYSGTESEKDAIRIEDEFTYATWHYNIDIYDGHVFEKICDDYCNICSSKRVVSSHTLGDWVIVAEPTCTEVGSKQKICTVCGEVLETASILSTGHYCVDNWTYDYDNETKTGVCSVCGETFTEELLPSDVLSFTLNDSGISYTVIDCAREWWGEIVIPDSYNGLPVTTIAADAFRDCTEITSVVIPESVTSIGGSAFRNCISLTEITLSKKITSIPGAMCFGCTSLEGVTIPDGVVNVGGYAFSGCTSLKTAAIPDSVTNIGGSLFTNCKSLIAICEENTIAHTYADSNDIPYILNTEKTKVNLTTESIYTDILGGSLSGIISGSDTVTYTMNTLFAGTGTIVDVLLNGEAHSQYTLVVNGDTNGDSVCDVLDCVDVEKTSNGNAELTDVYAEAGDINGDGIVDVNDYSAIVNKALAS